MATCKAVVVLCPNGRKVNVKIVPNSTVSKILEEVCKKQGVNPKEHGIKHQRKVLDNALPVKFSNLPNNAHLELVTETAPVKQGTSCTVALQLENGERLIHSFQPSSTLWDVLIHWDSQKERENEAKLTTRSSGDMIQLEPVCINMAEEIQGERNLRSTTLQSIGLSSGRAVIRLIHREAAPSSHLTSVPSESYDTNAMDIESQTEKSDQPDTHVAKSHDHLSSESIDRQESASSESANVTSTDIYPVASTVKEKKEILRKETNAASNDACNTSIKDISVQPQRSVTNSSVTSPSACVSSSSGLHIKEEDIPAIDFNAILEEERQRLRTEHDSKAERQAEGGLKKSKRPKLDHCAPLFPDFKPMRAQLLKGAGSPQLNNPDDEFQSLSPLNNLHCNEFDTSPSSVGHVEQETMNILHETTPTEMSDVDECCTHGTISSEFGSDSNETEDCSNCRKLLDRVRKLERTLENLKPNPEVTDFMRKWLTFSEGGASFSLQTSSRAKSSAATTKQKKHAKDKKESYFEMAPGKQELFTGSGVYINCVELHSILCASVGKPQEVLGRLVNYYFSDHVLSTSVPLQVVRSKDKNVLDQTIVHAIIAYARNCQSLWVREKKMSEVKVFDWARIIRNKCLTATRRLKNLKKIT